MKWASRQFVVFALALIMNATLSFAGTSQFSFRPDQIEMGAFFNGTSISFQAEIPSDSQAIVEVIGQTTEEHLMKKGRRGGLWMNVGEVHVKGAPVIYIAASTDAQLLQNPPKNVPWGYNFIASKIELSGQVSQEERDKLLSHFFKLKEEEGIYRLMPGLLQSSKNNPSSKGIRIAAEIPIPSSLKPGSYQVCLTTIANNEEPKKQCQELKAVMVGFPALIAYLAYQRSILYGVIAVIIAIITGFIMGYVFRKSGKGGGH